MLQVIKISNQKDLETAWAIRKVVFVIGQNCAEEIEWEYEDESIHFLALYDGVPAGTARWRKTDNGYKLERFAVLEEFRNEGVASALLQTVIADLPEKDKLIYLHAQLTAKGLYAKHGFTEVGDHFWEADIEHVKMKLG
jgi:predicted GNAT family N-acyltransferase